MSTVNRILLARGPSGSNLDKLFDVKANDGGQNEVILKKEYDISANVANGASKKIVEKAFIRSTLPETLVTATYIGQIYIKTDTNQAWIATGIYPTIWTQINIGNNIPLNNPTFTGDATFTGDISGVDASFNNLELTNALPVAQGGTGSTTAGAARTALGVDVAGTDNSTDVTLANVSDNYLSISNQEITAGIVPLALGGTGATTAAAARIALGIDSAGTDNSTDVTLANVSDNYLSISNQEITAGIVPLALGGTGATTAAAARTALDVDQAGTDNSTDVTLANTNYLSLSGQELTGGVVPIGSGGTGSTTASSARTALGVDTAISTAISDLVNAAPEALNTLNELAAAMGDDSNFSTTITNSIATKAPIADPTFTGTVSGVDLSFDNLQLTNALPVAQGGTGSTTASAARTALGVDAAGTDNSTDVTLANTNYLTLSGQELTGGTIPIGSGGTGATSAGAARTALGVDAAGTDNSTPVTLANVNGNYLSLSNQEITSGVVPLALGGTGATTAEAARIALGLDSAGTDNSTPVTLANTNYLSLSGQELTGGTIPIGSGGTGATNAANARSNLGLVLGSQVQPYHANLADIVVLTPENGNIIVGDGSNFVAESGATARTSLGLGSLATESSINNSNWSGADLAVANGGTGASDAAGARSNLGLGTAAEHDVDHFIVNGSSSNATFGNLEVTNLGIGTDSPIEALDVSGVLALRAGTVSNSGDVGKVDTNYLSYYTNTYIRFQDAGSVNDWAYLRQIGSEDNIEIALDFHDQDNEARFCIRSIKSDHSNNTHATKTSFQVRDNKVGILTDSPDATLEVNGDLFLEGTDNNWTTTTGKGLYFRFYTASATYNRGYIQSIDRSSANETHYPLDYHASEHNFRNKTTNFMKITEDGNVGIGTISPSYPLDVVHNNDDIPSVTGIMYYATGQSVNQNQQDEHKHVAVSANDGYYLGAGYVAYSDMRIKENIRDISDNFALQKLRDISAVQYEYKDKVNRGFSSTIGFIAQQVKEHMSVAVSVEKDIITNEMRVIENPLWTTLTDSSGKDTFKLTINDLNDNSGNILYRFYVSNDPSGSDECKKEVTSLDAEPKSFIFKEKWNNVFLYGKEIDDFHVLDKQKLFTLNFAATQEIDRIQQAEKIKLEEANQKIVELEAKNQQLETTLQQVLQRLDALENN